ncbi:MAG TPA: 50S ribosomal protein L10, partial [Acidobacteriota bacterium]|nr:50S ribosomal protein L10 [Acidobacteriota bacterium]
MNRTEKQSEVDQLKQDFSAISSAFLVDFRGMKVVDATELRRQIHKSQARLKVVKNTLALLATKGSPMEVLSDFFNGPTAIAYTSDDPVSLAKILNNVSKENPNLVIKAGYLDGSLIEAKRIGDIANLPSKQILQGQVVGLIASPLRRLLWVLNGTIQKFLVVLSEIQKNRPESSGGEMNTEEIIKSIEDMSVLQLSQLIKALEDKFGVSAAMAAPVATAAGATPAAGAAPAAEEKTTFDVILASFPADKKINIIKVVREVTSLG